jgi:hypothetical protein
MKRKGYTIRRSASPSVYRTDGDHPPPTVAELEEIARAAGERKAMRSLRRVTRRGSYLLKVQSLALVVGLSAGWQFMGLSGLVVSTLAPIPSTYAMLGTIVLIAAALGPRLPERVVVPLARLLQRRHPELMESSRQAGAFWLLQAGRERDESLLWIFLSALATVTGIVSLITFFLIGPAMRFYDLMLARFFWTNMTLAILEWVLLTLLLVWTWLLMGLVTMTLAPLVGGRVAEQRLPPGIAASLILGLGLSWLVHLVGTRWGWSAGQEYMLGVLPLFALAALAARFSQQTEGPSLRAERLSTDAPLLNARGEGLIWVCLMVWGAAASLLGSGWVVCQQLSDLRWPPDDHGLSKFVVLLGLGLAAASWRTWRQLLRERRTSGCGMAAWAAGVGASVAFMLIATWPDSRLSHNLAICSLALPVGYALHYVEGAWLARAGSGTLGFSQMTTALLGGAAMGLVLARWGTLPNLGGLGTISAGSLLLMAFGGLTQIYEQERSSHTRQLRLAMIFLSLAGAIVFFPMGVRAWSHREQKQLTATYLGLDSGWLGRSDAKAICLIGASPMRVPQEITERQVVSLLSWRPGVKRAIDPRPGYRVYDRSHLPAMRSLRVERENYDLIYQQGQPVPETGAFEAYSVEWWSRLADQVSPGGTLVVDVPLHRMNLDAVRLISSTFMTATRADCTGRLIQWQQPPVLRMAARFGNDSGGSRTTPLEFPLERLGPRESRIGVHSIRRNRIMPALWRGAGLTEDEWRATIPQVVPGETQPEDGQ